MIGVYSAVSSGYTSKCHWLSAIQILALACRNNLNIVEYKWSKSERLCLFSIESRCHDRAILTSVIKYLKRCRYVSPCLLVSVSPRKYFAPEPPISIMAVYSGIISGVWIEVPPNLLCPYSRIGVHLQLHVMGYDRRNKRE